MTHELEEYILAHIDAEPELLHRLNRDTHRDCLYPDMCSGHLQGRMLKMIVRMTRPQRVLELGTFTGYSALALAEGLEGDATLHTVEINDEMEDFIRAHFDQAPQGRHITLHIGDAMQLIEPLSAEFGPWDLVFIDANKRIYPDYYRAVKPHVRHGGFILVDNTLWYGKVETNAGDAQTQGILRFNDIVASDPDVETVIIPMRDGLTLLHVL